MRVRDKFREPPWGREEILWEGPAVTCKILTVHAGHRFSLQSHRLRSERWHVLGGEGAVEIGASVAAARPGLHFEVPAGAKHRLRATTADLHVLEIALGEFDQDDIIRYEDDYGRV